MAISAARGERRGAGLLALISIGILFATLMLGARVSPTAAVDTQPADCERPLDVVLIIDRSGSMDLVTDGQSRLGWAKDAANDLVTGLDNNGGVGAGGLHQVGLTTYGNRDNSDGIPAGFTRDLQLGASDATAVHAAINAYSDSAGSGNTPFRFGMSDGAQNMLAGDRTEVDGVPVLQVLIFLSDGRPNPDSLDPGSRPSVGEITAYLSSADQAYGIAIGPDGQGEPLSEPDLDLMHDISNPDPANFRHVVNAASLPNLFAAMQEELLCGDIQITKTPTPAGPVDEGTEVTYDYQVWNDGDTPISNVVVTDDTCSPVGYVNGDDGDGLLEKGEIWNYQCSMELEETTTNEACADGDFIGGGHDSACAEVTVEVNPPPPPAEPDIRIRKTENAAGTVEPGTKVTYTYEVKNTGDTPLSNVDVTDVVKGTDTVACDVDSDSYTGDDGNGILDEGETWTFTCSTNLQTTTENKACVSADVGANLDLQVAQQQVEDCDSAVVEVSHSPEQTVEAGTGTPVESQPDTSLNGAGGGVLPTILFSVILISSLGTLAYANVRAMRRLG